MRKRALKSKRQKKEKTSRADPLSAYQQHTCCIFATDCLLRAFCHVLSLTCCALVYHGPRARFHLYQCLQLLLRKQVAALTELWKLPPEFEVPSTYQHCMLATDRRMQVICRDVWALHLDTLPSPPPPEPILHAEDLAGGPSQSRARDSARADEEEDKEESDKEDSGEEDELKASSAKSSSDSDSSSDDEDARKKSAPPIAELDAALAELSERSSSSGSGDEDAGPSTAPPAHAKKRTRHADLAAREGPLSTLVVLLLACWFLRLPVMYQDIVRLVEQYKLPWLESAREIPASMRRHLNKWAIAALTPPVRLHLPPVFETA